MQNILRLQTKYGNERLENACMRALDYNACNYMTVKNILLKELDKKLDSPEAQNTKKLNADYAIDITQLLQ